MVFQMKKILSICIVLICAGGLSAIGQHPAPAWIETFEQSPANYVLPPGIPVPPSTQATGTLRYRFGISVGGSQLVVRLSNEVGDKPLKVAGASIGIAADEMNAVPGTIRRLTFNRKESIEIPAGAPLLSDPVSLRVASMSDLLCSIYVSENVEVLPMGGASMFLAEGNALLSEKLASARKAHGHPLVTSVLVLPDRPTHVVVALGDSITDPGRTNPTERHGWVATLAARMNADSQSAGITAVSAGISGNRILATMMGQAALARVDRDVFSTPGLSHVILLEGINDIGMSGKTPFGENPPPSFDDLIAGYRQLAMRAHMSGVKIFIGTLLPALGAFYFSDEKEKLRQAVNAWIRTSKDFDGVIDFEAVMRDPAHPDHLKPEFDSGDHLHPNETGYKAMGDAIDLSLFK